MFFFLIPIQYAVEQEQITGRSNMNCINGKSWCCRCSLRGWVGRKARRNLSSSCRSTMFSHHLPQSKISSYVDNKQPRRKEKYWKEILSISMALSVSLLAVGFCCSPNHLLWVKDFFRFSIFDAFHVLISTFAFT